MSLPSCDVDRYVRYLISPGFRLLFLPTKTCKRFNEVISNSVPLQYHIELGAHGMVDGPPGIDGMGGPLNRLEALRAFQQAWMTFTPRTIVVQKNLQIYKAVAAWGLPLKGCEFSGSRWIDASVDCRLEIVEAPSILRGINMDGPTVSQVTVDAGIVALTVDHQQDLLVTVGAYRDNRELRITLQSLKTRGYHPEAILPTLEHEYSPLDGYPESCRIFSVKISGVTLGLFLQLCGPYREILESSLYIWNWKTGESILVSQYYQPSSNTDICQRVGQRLTLLDAICIHSNSSQPGCLSFRHHRAPTFRPSPGLPLLWMYTGYKEKFPGSVPFSSHHSP
jgi:hypothetical protein